MIYVHTTSLCSRCPGLQLLCEPTRSVLASLGGIAQVFTHKEALSIPPLYEQSPVLPTQTSPSPQNFPRCSNPQFWLSSAFLGHLGYHHSSATEKHFGFCTFRCCNICIHVMRHLGMKTKSKHEIHLCITYAYLKWFIIFLACLYFDYGMSHQVRYIIFSLVVSC